ncbi:MAG: hypothetical protein ACC700_13810 [Anaerolineales bacterium]
MKTRPISALVFLAVTFPLIGMRAPAAAQGREPPPIPQPPRGPIVEGGPQQGPDGIWYVPAGPSPRPGAAAFEPLATGGPDQFGYTWDDSVAFSWIDASGGTDTGISGYGGGVGPIGLPFTFKYYENAYTQLYISAHGYVTFADPGFWDSQSPIPSPSEPNNVIAPYWTPIFIPSGGWVRYLSGGAAPDRYFVIEWHDVTDPMNQDEFYRFELILHESGDIVFQYQTMAYVSSFICGAAGIEDSTGLDGLTYLELCTAAPSSRAVRFYRPPPMARVSVLPLYHGSFLSPGGLAPFEITLRNTGELGADTYELFTSSSWAMQLYTADGSTPFTDTDSDGTVDTGSIPQGGQTTVVAKVEAPSSADVGDANQALITARSSLDASKSKTATLQTAVPAPFAQAFRDNADGAMSVLLARPQAQVIRKATSDEYDGRDMAIVETPGFVYAWTRDRCIDGPCSTWISEIEYTLLDRQGDPARAITKLADHSSAAINTYDSQPALAVAPNGRIGLLWYRQLWDSATSEFNFNIYFAVLDRSGAVIFGPQNLTNNAVWGTWSDLNVPRFSSPHLAATGDNRFLFTWGRSHQEASGWVFDIYFAVRDSQGNDVKPVTKLTNDTPGWDDGYNDTTVTSLSGSHALLAFTRSDGDIYYSVVDSSGIILKAMTNLSGDGSLDWDFSPDAVQLPAGNIVVGWHGFSSLSYTPNIRFAILDSSYNMIGGPTTMANSPALGGDGPVSVAAAGNHAVLTWMDEGFQRSNSLYYALVGEDGTVVTPPMIFRSAGPSAFGAPYIETSYGGYGNTSYFPWALYLPQIMKNP